MISTTILTLVLIYLSVVATWVLYLAVMNIAENRAELTRPVKVIVYTTVLPIGYLMDAMLNLTFCLFVWRRPKDFLLTGTLKRVLSTEQGWRETIAAWICQNLLNPFDPKGHHC